MKCRTELIVTSGIYGEYLKCPSDTCDVTQHCNSRRQPVGKQSTQEMRDARKRAHAAFDFLWIEKIFESRSAAYAWLAEQLKVPRIHIAECDVETCNKIVELSAEKELA